VVTLLNDIATSTPELHPPRVGTRAMVKR
jgi:hypothetical protein